MSPAPNQNNVIVSTKCIDLFYVKCNLSPPHTNLFKQNTNLFQENTCWSVWKFILPFDPLTFVCMYSHWWGDVYIWNLCVQVQIFTARAWRRSAATLKHPSAWPPQATSSCCGGRPIMAPTGEASTLDTWVSIKVCIQLITIFSFFWCFLSEKPSGDKNHGFKITGLILKKYIIDKRTDKFSVQETPMILSQLGLLLLIVSFTAWLLCEVKLKNFISIIEKPRGKKTFTWIFESLWEKKTQQVLNS